MIFREDNHSLLAANSVFVSILALLGALVVTKFLVRVLTGTTRSKISEVVYMASISELSLRCMQSRKL